MLDQNNFLRNSFYSFWVFLLHVLQPTACRIAEKSCSLHDVSVPAKKIQTTNKLPPCLYTIQNNTSDILASSENSIPRIIIREVAEETTEKTPMLSRSRYFSVSKYQNIQSYLQKTLSVQKRIVCWRHRCIYCYLHAKLINIFTSINSNGQFFDHY